MDIIQAFSRRRYFALINQPEINNVDRDFGIVNRFHHFPTVLFNRRRIGFRYQRMQLIRFLAQCIGIDSGNPHHVTVFGDHGIVVAERLMNGDYLALT